MKRNFVTTALAASIALASSTAAQAHEGQVFYYKNDSRLSPAQAMEMRRYLENQEREPCQGYLPPPAPFIRVGCDLVAPPPPPAPAMTQMQQTTTTTTTTTELRPIISFYTIHFDFDKSNIRDAEWPTLQTVAREIKTYEPYEVTLEGHADRSGSDDYNMRLSQKRAQAVSETLTGMGIPNRVLSTEAWGESKPAVPTADGVRLEENRRVEIQFRK